ncbi:GIY-YIG nuclease family protein [Hellea balneolensis]|uniref:GIY-YIG nuclease family protein n=1 Tax=Hellea balneolensis TaxID=287478 RepID=UPI00040D882B|nr:GIY-YIG nuclease family protein [Hellea balneolensis]
MYELTFWTYIITNAYKGTLYTGHTDDIGTRMEQHITGAFESFSKRYKLKHLIWYQEFETRDEAFKKERQIKEWKRQWKLNLIEDMNPLWVDIHSSPMWPLPGMGMHPELYKRCLEHCLDPDLRRDERRYFD